MGPTGRLVLICCNPSFSHWDRLAVFLVELLDLENVFPRLNNIVIELVPPGQSSKLRPRYASKGTKEQSPYSTIDSPSKSKKQRCRSYIEKARKNHVVASSLFDWVEKSR